MQAVLGHLKQQGEEALESDEAKGPYMTPHILALSIAT